MVDGSIVAENGRLLNGDMAQYIADVDRTAAEVIERRTAWLKDNEAGVETPV